MDYYFEEERANGFDMGDSGGPCYRIYTEDEFNELIDFDNYDFVEYLTEKEFDALLDLIAEEEEGN